MKKKGKGRKVVIPWGKMFQKYRQNLGLTQEDVKDALGVPLGTIVGWEAGYSTPNRARWEGVGAFLGWTWEETLQYFLGDEPYTTDVQWEEMRRGDRVKDTLAEAEKEAKKKAIQDRYRRGYHAWRKKGGK